MASMEGRTIAKSTESAWEDPRTPETIQIRYVSFCVIDLSESQVFFNHFCLPKFRYFAVMLTLDSLIKKMGLFFNEIRGPVRAHGVPHGVITPWGPWGTPWGPKP